MELVGVAPEVISPPAIVQTAFDEQRALADIKAAVERRDVSKGEFRVAILDIGRMFLSARAAMPGALYPNGAIGYSEAFKVFVEKTGFTMSTAAHYMSYARNPARLDAAKKTSSASSVNRRKAVLREVAELLEKAPSIEEARQVIQEELHAIG